MAIAAPKRGFLPESDPLTSLPEEFRVWDNLLEDLPDLLAAGRARTTLARMPLVDYRGLEGLPQKERALGILSVFGHAAVHESWRSASMPTVPKCIAVPWVSLATAMHRHPVLTYASHGQNNWRRLSSDGAIALGNIAVLRNFFGGLDENWFVATHVDIEASAAPLVTATAAAQEAVRLKDAEALQESLRIVADSLTVMQSTLLRVRDNCDPQIFFTRVQPFMQGMKDVIYEGAEEFGGAPQNFPGGSGAQSTLMPLVDALLGVTHAEDKLITYLHELRRYMPREHQLFLAEVEHGPSVRNFIEANRDQALVAEYNRSIEGLGTFRAEHLSMSIEYIQKPARQQASLRGEHGTGGSPFVGYLEKHRKETFANLL